MKKKSKVSLVRFINRLTNEYNKRMEMREKSSISWQKSTSVGNKVVSMRNRVRRFVMVASVSKYFQSTETEQCRLE